MDTIQRLSLYIFFFLLAYMPFHIFLSTWVESSFHILGFAHVARDGLLLVGAVLAFVASTKQPWFKQLFKDRLHQLMLAYAALTILLAVVRPSDQGAEILGVVCTTGVLLFFLY